MILAVIWYETHNSTRGFMWNNSFTNKQLRQTDERGISSRFLALGVLTEGKAIALQNV